jgi:anti-sigma factor RsiW
VTCAESLPLIPLELDGELDARSVLELDEHIANCPSCTREAASLRALSQAAREHLPRYELPATLERKLRRSVRPRRTWVMGASALAAAAAVAIIALPRADSVSREAIDAHARSLQLEHAIDVPTSDQHTVKPWFEGKVGFAVPVRDYAAEGFTLAGGRLDYLDGRPAAAIVYRHGKHLVNLFVVDSRGARDAPVEHSDVRGFGCWSWTRDGLRYFLVGDVAAADMAPLAQKMSQQP